MLQPVESFNDINIGIGAMIKGWCALCPDSGAYLSRTRGRPKAGNGYKYVLIVPNESLDNRRKFIRAWDDIEAIELANKKLAKIKTHS